MSIIKNITNTLSYGFQHGKTHRDGSVVRKGNDYLGKSGVRTILDKDGNVKEYICKKWLSKDTFEVVHATPIKNDSIRPSEESWRREYDVVKSHYINRKDGDRCIIEDRFVGQYYDGSEGTNRGWFLSRYNQSNVSSETYKLPRH